MKLIILPLLLLTAACGLRAQTSPQDELLQKLSGTTDPKEQARLYRNLADLAYDTPDEFTYLHRLIDKAKETGQTDMQLEALTDLAMAFLDDMQSDSGKYYIAQVDRIVPHAAGDRWRSYLSMYLFNAEVHRDSEGKVLAEKLESYRKEQPEHQSLYKQIENAYILGTGCYKQEMYKEALPYLEKAVELSDKLPFKEGCLYMIVTRRQLARVYSPAKEHAKAIAETETLIGLKERYFNEFYKNERPYYPMNSYYIYYYSSLLTNTRFMPKEKAEFYMNRVNELNETATNPLEKYSVFFAQNNYYLSQNDWKNSMITIDSLIYYAKQMAPYNLPELYRLGSMLQEELGHLDEALVLLRESHRIDDSLSTKESQDKMSELQVLYDVNQLNYEKSQLELKNKRTLLVCLSALLLIVALVCLYLYRNLKKERQMKEKMRILKTLAEESEKMKTAFINSICHEIRTPLNAIVGFAQVLTDDSLDEDSRANFSQEIEQNTEQLTTLINSMLEVSNLDVSDEKLPCEPADITALCNHGIEYLRTRVGTEIECRAEFSEVPTIIPTNERYLSLVIENLLGNAGKFTERGSIVLQCDKQDKNIVISVTDTGCGIPEHMRETVFERFTKVDDYKQGSGLGLYLCRLIVTRLSGKIYIDPGYAAGTRILVVLPAE